jgi:TonB-dependent receptor
MLQIVKEDYMFRRYSYSRVIGTCIVLLLCIMQVSVAQDFGNIRGRVFDKETGQPLIGANIVVVNTSLGAGSDPNGEFYIHNVPAGEHSVKASYVGYSAVTLKVMVPAGKEAMQMFFLTPATIMGVTVVVTAQAAGQLSAINQQLSSNKIVNVVSEERIQELPDFNAAAAISRLPGISTLQSSGEANKIVIRGLAPQFNAIAISGITLASTGSTQIGVTSIGITSGLYNQDRSVDLSMMSPYMIKSIEVYKSLTPDMNANVLGGFVNMQLREAPSDFHTDLLWQSGYTQKSNTYGNYRAVGSVSGRLFDDKFGAYILANIEQYDRSADNMNAGYTSPSNSKPDTITGYKPVDVTNVTLQRHIETRKRYGANLILDYRLPSGSIKLVNMFSRLNSNSTDYQTILDYYPDNNVNFSYRHGDANTDLAINSLEAVYDFGLFSATLKAANSYSRNNNPNSPLYQFLQTGGSASATDNTIPEDLGHQVHFYGDTSTYLTTINLLSADYKENDQSYNADIKFPFTLHQAVSGFIKVGGEYRYNFRTNNQSTPYISPKGTPGMTNPDINNLIFDSLVTRFPEIQLGNSNRLPGNNFTNTNSDFNSAFLDNRFGQMFWVVDPALLDRITNYLSTNPSFAATTSNGGWFNGIFQQLPNDYKYIEKYYAAYVMAELDLGPDWLIVGGVRYEQTKSLFEAFNMVDLRNVPPNQPYFPVTAYPQNHYILPMVQTKYKVTEFSDVRYSYSQTLARPDYTQLSPHYVINSAYSAVYSGNPKLTPAHSYNHDLEFTIHSSEIGLISLGAFYKTINNFTYYTSYRLYSAPAVIPPGLDSVGVYPLLAQQGGTVSGKATLNTYINSPYKAYIKGIEADFQTSLRYLPYPLDGIVLGINYSHIWSSATYPYIPTRNIPDPSNPRRSIVSLIDSSRGGRLIYQPNDIMNGYIGYDLGGFSGRVSFVYQGNSVSNIGGDPEQDGFTKDYFRIDASARYILPWFPNLQLFLDVNNINQRANMSAQKTIGGFTNEQFYGLTANLGVRYIL